MMPSPSLDAGLILSGRYRVDALVHARRGAAHYSATDLSRGDRVSVHVHAAGAATTALSPCDWFLGGAAWAKTLSGPHIAKVLDAGVGPGGHPYLVREHVGSTPLSIHLARHGALPMGDAVDVALAVCDALVEAHSKAILHGGLGAHCVHAAWSASGLVDVKVTGIGTAIAEHALALGATGSGDGVLRAPEQLRHGAPIDTRIDVWALGALLFTMLAGAPPFKADTPSGASLSVAFDDAPRLANVPTGLADVIDRALARDPEDRPRNVLELADALAFYATSPDFARERITARRPLMAPLLPAPAARPSGPTLAIDRGDYTALAREQQAAHPHLPPVMIDASLLETTRKRPSSHHIRVRAAAAQATTPLPLPAPPRKPRVDETVLVRAVFPRRRALKIMGGVTAVVSILLVVLLGTEVRARRAEARAEAAQHNVIAASSAPVPCRVTPSP